jgi:hypothetical protein
MWLYECDRTLRLSLALWYKPTQKGRAMTWADSNAKWDGFRLTSYRLDTEKVLALPLFEERRADGEVENIPTTVGEVFNRYADGCDGVEYAIFAVEVTSGNEKTIFAGLPFNRRLLEVLLTLWKEGANPFSSEWFFYDHDTCMDDPQELYRFFVVNKDKNHQGTSYFLR